MVAYSSEQHWELPLLAVGTAMHPVLHLICNATGNHTCSSMDPSQLAQHDTARHALQKKYSCLLNAFANG